MIQKIKKYPLISYVILNYVISWTFLYPAYQAILNAEEGTFPMIALIGIIGGFGPSISALIIVYITDGKSEVYGLLRKYKIVRVHLKWYAFVMFVPSIIYFIAILMTSLVSFELGNLDFIEAFKMFFPYFLLALPFGPVMEELGWRGYMLPKLLDRYGIFSASLILGLVWTFWHIASFTFPGAAIPSVFEVNAWSILLYTLSITSQTLVFTYIYLKTKGSVFIAILLHAFFNASSNVGLTLFPDIVEDTELRVYLYIFFIFITGCLGFILLKNYQIRINQKIKFKKIFS